jgi:tetratricopeptide (TPR) repeat protein
MKAVSPDPRVLPFPVAYPLSYARDEGLTASERVDNVLFGGYQAVRTTTLLLLADYLESETACLQVSEGIRGLRLPHWKEWVELCTALAKFWRGDYPEARPERETRFPELVRAWLEEAYPKRQRDEEPWRSVLKDLPGGRGPARGPVDALWEARNRRAHGSGTRTGDTSRDEKLLLRLLPVLERMTEALFGGGEFRLLRKVGEEEDGTLRVIRLHGPHRDRLFEIETLGEGWASAFRATGIAALAGDEAVAIHPLFLPHDPEQTLAPGDSGGFLEDLYLLDLVSERKVVSLGVLEPWKLTDRLAADVTAALRRKQVDFGLDEKATTRWTLADWSASTSGRLLSELTGRKYFPDFYLERTGVDEVVRRSLGLDPRFVTEESEKRGKALLLLGETGSGKSSLLCRLVHDLLERKAKQEGEEEADPDRSRGQSKKRRGKGKGSASLDEYLEKRGSGDVVLFLQGAAAYSGDMGEGADALLCDAVVRQGGVIAGRARPFASLEHFVKRLDQTAKDDRNADRKVWIVLDALNEADRYRDLLGALDRFLPSVAEYPWLRLVVSIRSGAYFEMAEREKEALVHGGVVFRNDRHWAQFPSERPDPFGRKKDVPYLEIRPFAAGKEGAEAYRLRQEQGGERSSAIRYEDLPGGVKTLLLSPLHLHLFHETWAGKTRVPPDLDEIGLFDAFIKHLTEGIAGLEERLHELAGVMLKERKAVLPIEVAEAWEEEWRRGSGSIASRLAKLSPVEELVAASILMRPSEEGEGTSRRLVGYRFSHQSLAAAVLLRSLRKRVKGRELPTADELLAWAKEASGETTAGHEPFPELVDAAAAFVVAVTRAGDGGAVARLLELDVNDIRKRFVVAGLVAYGPMRGSREELRESGRQFWSTFGTCLKEGENGERFCEASWEVQAVSETTGFSQAAQDIARLRLQFMRKFVAAEPSRLDWKRGLTNSLLRMSDLLKSSGQTEEAARLVGESLGAIRELVAAEPSRLDWKRDLTVSLERMSDLLKSSGQTEEAVRLVGESLGMMRELVAAEPSRLDWKWGLTNSLLRMSNLLKSGGQTEEAARLVGESLGMTRELVAAEPSRLDWKRGLTNSLERMSDLLKSSGQTEEAARLVGESLGMRRELVAAEPSRLDWKRDLTVSLERMSDVLESSGQMEVAARLVGESLGMTREVVAAEPSRLDWKWDLTNSLLRMSDLLKSGGQTEEAARLVGESLGMTRELVAAEPSRLDWKRDLAVSLERMSDLLKSSGQTEEAVRLVGESLGMRRELVATEPSRLDWKGDLTISLLRMSDLLKSSGQTEEAARLVGESLGMTRELVAAEPSRLDWKGDLTISLLRMSDLLKSSGQTEEAARLVGESLGMTRELVAAEPSRLNWKRDLTVSLLRMSDLLKSSGQTEEAARLVGESLGMTRELVAAEPSRLDWKEDLVKALDRLGAWALDSGDVLGAEAPLKEAFSLSGELARYDLTVDMIRVVGIVRNRRARLLAMTGRVAESEGIFAEVLSERRAVLAEGWTFSKGISLVTSIGFLAAVKAEGGFGREVTSLVDEAEETVGKLDQERPGDLATMMEREHIRLQRHRGAIRSGQKSDEKRNAIANLRKLKADGVVEEKIERLLREAESLPDDPAEPRHLRAVFV